MMTATGSIKATTDGVNCQRYAGFWRRALAAYIDFLLVAAIVSPLLYQVEVAGTGSDGDIVRDVLSFMLIWVFPAACILAFWHTKQATPGKLLGKICIVDAGTGDKPTTRQFLIRLAGYLLSAAVLMLGFLWAAFSPRRQGWHDKLAGTIVVAVGEN